MFAMLTLSGSRFMHLSLLLRNFRYEVQSATTTKVLGYGEVNRFQLHKLLLVLRRCSVKSLRDIILN